MEKFLATIEQFHTHIQTTIHIQAENRAAAERQIGHYCGRYNVKFVRLQKATWARRIAWAIKTRELKDLNTTCAWYDMDADANNFHTCAIGEKLNIPAPRPGEYVPVSLASAIKREDRDLYDLGCQFTLKIARGKWEEAQQLRAEISDRLTAEKIQAIKSRLAA